MSNRAVGKRESEPHHSDPHYAGVPVATIFKLISANDASSVENALHCTSFDENELHQILFRACYDGRDRIVEVLIQHPRYTTGILASIVVDALAYMQAEFAFDLLNRPSFKERALNAALHEAAGRHDEEDQYSIVKELVKLGADVGSRDEKGRTALEIAQSAGAPPAKLISLLSTTKMQKTSALPSQDALAPVGLPPEIGERNSTSNLLSDRKTAGLASGDRRITHPQLETKRGAAPPPAQVAKPDKQDMWPGIVLEIIQEFFAEDGHAQSRMLKPLMTMLEGLAETERLAAMLSFCDGLDALKGKQPWPGIFKWISTLMLTMTPAENLGLCLKLCGNFGRLPAIANGEIFELVLQFSRALEGKDKAPLLLFFAQNMAVLAKNGSHFLEEGFRQLIGECADIGPEQSGPILVVLCCRLEEFEADKRIELYMLLVDQLKILTPKAQRKLLTGWGLIHKLSFLPEKDGVAAYKALAAWALQLPEDERKPAVKILTDREEALRHLPRTAEIREVREKLEQSVKKDS